MTTPTGLDALAPPRWSMPDGEDRCPGCGRFVAIEDGFLDVEPGGVRGEGDPAYYCGPDCTGRVRCAHGHPLDGPCADGCEQ